MEEDVKYNFVIDVLLIDPVKDIVKKLEQREFRDIDIEYLNERLEKFTKIVCELMEFNTKGILFEDKKGYVLNSYAIDRYTKYFNTLLKFFENLKQ